AYRVGEVGAEREHRNIMARRQQDAADIFERAQEPGSRDQRIRHGIHEAGASPGPPGGREVSSLRGQVRSMKRALLLALAACFFVNNVRAAAAARYPVTG